MRNKAVIFNSLNFYPCAPSNGSIGHKNNTRNIVNYLLNVARRRQNFDALTKYTPSIRLSMNVPYLNVSFSSLNIFTGDAEGQQMLFVNRRTSVTDGKQRGPITADTAGRCAKR